MKIFIVLCTALFLSACDTDKEIPVQQQAIKTIEGIATNVKTITVPVWFHTGGVVTTDHRVTVSSRLSGYVRKLHIREGQRVKKGSLLFRIDPVDVKQVLAQANADAANARAEQQRFASLLKASAVTKQQYDTVALRYTLAQSRVKQAKNQLHYTNVRSSLDGIVVKKLMHNGDLASPGQAVLIIENPQQLLVEAKVSESRVARLHEGDAVRLQFAAFNTSFTGNINHIIADQHAESHQFLVKISLPSNPAIRPGMFAHVAFHQGQREALMIPRAAVVYRAGLTGAYLLDDKNIVHYRLIRLGEQHGHDVEISAGLDAGESLVAKVTPALHSGVQLRTSQRP
ncbi:MAG: efflux RND transporter periplasmic adaptor subunit [Mariprofundaceae bacterium]|nr:efflux RND transporter periplasmic adaptor subunit [Mariprofundaceae bacterium]